MALFDANAFLAGAVPASQIVSHAPLQLGLHASFLLISLGAYLRLDSQLSTQWKWAVRAALTILACAVVGQLAAVLIRMEWLADFSAGLGAADGLEWRLFRLGAMAAYAVPMLTLLAAGEYKQKSVPFAKLLVRWEPLLFAIGAATLASILLAAAFINKELAWLAPIGADTTVAACAAAAIRARWRTDGLAFTGWLLVCASMTIGLLMGAYAFDGPMPAPSFIGDYNALPRMLLRDVHVIILSLGIVGIAVAATRQSQKA